MEEKESLESTIDDEIMGQFKGILAEIQAPPEAAQKLFNLHEQKVQSVYDFWYRLQREWRAEIEADPEIGGEQLIETQTAISELINTMPCTLADDFRQALNFTGAGNNPAIVRGLHFLKLRLIKGGKQQRPDV